MHSVPCIQRTSNKMGAENVTNVTEVRVFGGNGRAQCATSIPPGQPPRDERTEARSSSPKAPLPGDCGGTQQQNSGSRGTSQVDGLSSSPFAAHSPDPQQTSCSGAYRFGGSKRANPPPALTLGRTGPRPLVGRIPPVTRWREVSALLIRTTPMQAEQLISIRSSDSTRLARVFPRQVAIAP